MEMCLWKPDSSDRSCVIYSFPEDRIVFDCFFLIPPETVEENIETNYTKACLYLCLWSSTFAFLLCDFICPQLVFLDLNLCTVNGVKGTYKNSEVWLIVVSLALFYFSPRSKSSWVCCSISIFFLQSQQPFFSFSHTLYSASAEKYLKDFCSI